MTHTIVAQDHCDQLAASHRRRGGGEQRIEVRLCCYCVDGHADAGLGCSCCSSALPRWPGVAEHARGSCAHASLTTSELDPVFKAAKRYHACNPWCNDPICRVFEVTHSALQRRVSDWMCVVLIMLLEGCTEQQYQEAQRAPRLRNIHVCSTKHVLSANPYIPSGTSATLQCETKGLTNRILTLVSASAWARCEGAPMAVCRILKFATCGEQAKQTVCLLHCQVCCHSFNHIQPASCMLYQYVLHYCPQAYPTSVCKSR